MQCSDKNIQLRRKNMCNRQYNITIFVKPKFIPVYFITRSNDCFGIYNMPMVAKKHESNGDTKKDSEKSTRLHKEHKSLFGPKDIYGLWENDDSFEGY